MVQTRAQPGFLDYNSLSLPGEVFFNTSPEKIYFRDFFKFHNFFTYSCLHQQRCATPDVRLCCKRTRRPKPCTHAPCNFRLESVPLPPFSLLPLLSKLRATSCTCSHEKTPSVTHIIREVKLSETQQPSRDCGGIVQRKQVRVLRPAYLPDFQQVISRFRSVVVSHNFLPSVYSSHATYTRHFLSQYSLIVSLNACAHVLVSVPVTYSQCAGHAGLVAKGIILTHRSCSRWLATVSLNASMISLLRNLRTMYIMQAPRQLNTFMYYRFKCSR